MFSLFVEVKNISVPQWTATTETEFVDPLGEKYSDIELTMPELVSPGDSWLGNNSPNPFDDNTLIPFYLQSEAMVKLTVTNSLGQEVKTILNQNVGSGIHYQYFDSERLPAGSYYYTLEVGDGSKMKAMTKKMVIIR